MQVLLVSHQYPPEGIAGVERYTESLAHQLVSDANAVAVITRRLAPAPFDPELRRDRNGSNVRVFRIVGGRVSLDEPLLHSHRLERLVTQVIVDLAPDVIHFNHLVGMPLRFPLIARRLRVPTVLTLFDHYGACPLEYLQKRSGEPCAGPDGGLECARTCFEHQPRAADRWKCRAEFFQRLLAFVDRLLCPSSYVASYFEEFAPSAAPIQVLPLGVRARSPNHAMDEARARRGDGILRLAYLGAVAPHKGVHVIVDAIELAAVPATLALYGKSYDAAYVDSIERRAAAISLPLDVHGEYAGDEIPDLLRDVDLVVAPSQVREVFPFAPREALACGVPVLVGHLGGLPEAVVEGENGHVFDSYDVSQLASLLQRLSDDPAALGRLRRGARARPPLTIADHARTMRDIYEQVVENSLLKPREESEIDELEDACARLENAFA